MTIRTYSGTYPDFAPEPPIPYCAIGLRAGLPHHWDFPPEDPEDEVDLSAPKREVGTCRDCGVSREFTNAPLKGSNWGSLFHAKRGGAAKKAR